MSSVKQHTFYIKNKFISDKLQEYIEVNDINKSSYLTRLVKNSLLEKKIITLEELNKYE